MSAGRVVRFGLVGCGKIAKKHVAALRCIPGVEIAAVCDEDESRSRSLAGELRVPAYRDANEMLRKERPEAVCVLVPSGAHGSVARSVLDAGCHAVVEKPLVLQIEEGRSLLAAAEKADRGVFVVNQNRFNRPIRRLHEAIRDERFGKMVLGSVRVRWKRTQEYYDEAPWRGTWKLDGGVLANQALHHLDMLLWLMGSVEQVTAATVTRLADIEVEDTAVAIFRFASGALGVIEATTAARPKDLEGTLSVLGAGGSVEVGGFSMDALRTWQFAPARDSDESIWKSDASNPADFAWNHARYLESVVDRIRAGRVDAEEAREACRVVELLDAIYDSAASGRAVRPGEALGLSRLGRG